MSSRTAWTKDWVTVRALRMPTRAPIQDGETFTVSDGRNPPRTFEYDLNGSVAAGNVAIVITRFMPENTIALRTYNAIAGALPDAVSGTLEEVGKARVERLG